MLNVSIKIDWDITPELIEIYAESTGDRFVGFSKGQQDLENAKIILEDMARVKMIRNNSTLGITKIFNDGILVGFSFPRFITEKENEVFKINNGKQYARVGTIYISKKHQGKGVGLEVIKLFTEEFKNLIWTCNSLNESSHKLAIKAGLKFSHQVYVKSDDRSWKFHDFEGCNRVDNVYKVEVN